MVRIHSAHRFRNADAGELAIALKQSRLALERSFCLFEEALAEQSFLVPRSSVVNPPLWELGHVAWFQERWLGRNPERDLGMQCNPDAMLHRSILDGADELFDSSAVGHSTRWSLPLPDFATTKSYANDVFDQTIDLLNDKTESEASHYLFWLCAAHEFMHAEAFSYMANTLSLTGAARLRKECLQQTALIQGLQGFPEQANRFRFDNESAYQFSQAALENAHEIELDSSPVSWEMLCEFRASSQYMNDKYWQGQPRVWSRAVPLDAENHQSAAAHVSYWEAKAWCAWRGRALPSEAQWLAAVVADQLQWGQVWEWTRSEFIPFTDFVAHPYRDYSQPWFNQGFMVLKGGSIYTDARLKHPVYRNFFLPERDDVCTGFRSCRIARKTD